MTTRKTIAWESWNAKMEDPQTGTNEVTEQEQTYSEIEHLQA